jgi:hypothetical protein
MKNESMISFPEVLTLNKSSLVPNTLYETVNFHSIFNHQQSRADSILSRLRARIMWPLNRSRRSASSEAGRFFCVLGD